MESTKSPVTLLQELSTKFGVTPKYIYIDQRGPPHCPSFECECYALELIGRGLGRSKRDAKRQAALRVLEQLQKRPVQYATSISVKSANPAITTKAVFSVNPANTTKPVSTATPPDAINHISQLTEMCAKYGLSPPEWRLVSDIGLPHLCRFKVAYRVGTHELQGVASSKRAARQAAAAAMVAYLGESPTRMTTPKIETGNSKALKPDQDTFVTGSSGAGPSSGSGKFKECTTKAGKSVSVLDGSIPPISDIYKTIASGRGPSGTNKIGAGTFGMVGTSGMAMTGVNVTDTKKQKPSKVDVLKYEMGKLKVVNPDKQKIVKPDAFTKSDFDKQKTVKCEQIHQKAAAKVDESKQKASVSEGAKPKEINAEGGKSRDTISKGTKPKESTSKRAKSKKNVFEDTETGANQEYYDLPNTDYRNMIENVADKEARKRAVKILLATTPGEEEGVDRALRELGLASYWTTIPDVDGGFLNVWHATKLYPPITTVGLHGGRQEALRSARITLLTLLTKNAE